jgi:hypothetical protein
MLCGRSRSMGLDPLTPPPLLRNLRLVQSKSGTLLVLTLARKQQMSQADELGSNYQHPVNGTIAKGIGSRRSLDWAVLVVAFALGSTLAWIALLLWALVHAFRFFLT